MSYDKALGYSYEKYLEEIKRVIPKGTIIGHRDRGRIKILTDTTAHGCPLVRVLSTGEEFYMTVYLFPGTEDFMWEEK